MPVNVLNEKIYLLLWFALFSVAAFTVIHHIIAAVILSYRYGTLWNKQQRKDM